MKKKIIGVVLALMLIVSSLGLGFWRGVKTKQSEGLIIRYAKEKNYTIISYKNGIISTEETAKRIGETVLVAKDRRGDKPIDISYDKKDKYWRVDGRKVGSSEQPNEVYSVLIRIDGAIITTVCKE